MFLIAGLGNPGKEYEMTRHNIGFIAAEYLADAYGIKLNKLKHKAVLGEGIIEGEKVIIAKPQTYMNNSGESIRDIAEYYKILPSDIIVIYDDVSIEVGRIRIRPKGSAGGHNGMKSIIYHLKDDNFPRIRIGVGEPKHDLADYVLGRFSAEELPAMRETVRKIEKIIPLIIKDGVPSAMNRFNGNADN